MDIPQRIPRPNPISQANFFARHFLVWFWPIFRLGSQKPLKVDDLWDPAPEDQAKENVEKLERLSIQIKMEPYFLIVFK